MTNNIVVSVIIPTYNRAKTITNSILSVTSQTFKELEVLIIDDGSTDNTEEVVQKLIDSDERIRYIKQTNGGANHARNHGIRLSKGKYVAFNDSDDVWHVNKLETELDYLEHNSNIKGIFSKFKLHFINEGHNVVAPDFVKRPLFIQLLSENVVNTPNLIIERKIIQEFGGFSEKLRRFQDWELATRVAQKYELFFVNEILVDTYQYGSGHISNNQRSGIESYKQLEEEFAVYRNQYPKAKCNFYFNMVTFMRGTNYFYPNLLRSIKLCRFSPKLIAKFLKFFITQGLKTNQNNRRCP